VALCGWTGSVKGIAAGAAIEDREPLTGSGQSPTVQLEGEGMPRALLTVAANTTGGMFARLLCGLTSL
jgi:hypothetical protein